MYLRWNSSLYQGLNKLMLPLENIWVPDLVVENRYYQYDQLAELGWDFGYCSLP